MVNQDQGPLIDMQGEAGPAGLAKELLEPNRMIKDADSNSEVPEYTVHHRAAGGPTRTSAPLVPLSNQHRSGSVLSHGNKACLQSWAPTVHVKRSPALSTSVGREGGRGDRGVPAVGSRLLTVRKTDFAGNRTCVNCLEGSSANSASTEATAT